MEILGIIPARGGSKSIKGKNIVLLNGKPLIGYTCEAALRSKRLSRVILNTDDGKIASVVEKYGIEVPFMRPKSLAKDTTLIIDVLVDVLRTLKEKENYEPDALVLLQPTSPLRTEKHIDAAVDLFMKGGADSVVSVVEVPHQFNPVSVMNMEDGNLKPYDKGKMILRRQDKPKVYGRNGPAVLVVKTSTVLNEKSLYGSSTKALIMKSEESIDVDSEFDLKLAGFFLKSK